MELRNVLSGEWASVIRWLHGFELRKNDRFAVPRWGVGENTYFGSRPRLNTNHVWNSMLVSAEPDPPIPFAER